MIKEFKHWVYNQYRKFIWLLSLIGRKTDALNDQSELYVITVSYNHVRLIEKQIELIKQHGKDRYFKHIIVDNSPKRKIRKEIKELCEREEVEYVPVPLYIDWMICHTLFGYGLSHGAALNWMFYHFLKHRRPVRFALIDHDVFPMEDYSFIDKLGGHDFYGVERNRESGWYLWPGWCVFKYDAIADSRPNFLPVFADGVFLDAGGSNYFCFYSHYDLKSINFPVVDTIRIKHSKGLTTHDDIYHGDCVQQIDHAWLHLINGSNYAKIPGKEKLVNKMIDNIEKLYLEVKEDA